MADAEADFDSSVSFGCYSIYEHPIRYGVLVAVTGNNTLTVSRLLELHIGRVYSVAS